jgi:type II secretory pathway component PulM
MPVLIMLGAVALFAIAMTVFEPQINRWEQRRAEHRRLRAVVAVVEMFNGGRRSP